MKMRVMSLLKPTSFLITALFIASCGIKMDTAYEFDELYTGPGDTYITDYRASAIAATTPSSPVEDDYVTNADRNTSTSPWSQNGWGNSGYGSYNYGAYYPFNSSISMMWMPYWAYSPTGFYNSPYAYNSLGTSYGGYGSSYYNPYSNPYYSPYNYYGYSGNWDSNSRPVIHGSRQPIASNTGTNSSYTSGRFYLGQNRQTALQKPNSVMTTPKPNKNIPSGKVKDNIARAYKRAENTGERSIDHRTDQRAQTSHNNPEIKPVSREQNAVRDHNPVRETRPAEQHRPIERPSAPARPSTPNRTASPGKSGRP